ncbi:MAG: AAA family ATPase, partial [Bacilli bacterium]|nr:AAA family ATPase [Bacilli bacterium]
MINNYGSLAVRYRPTEFEDVCGQNITTTILKKMIERKSFSNCLGFFGVSGTGKTTCARIFANKINNGVGEPIEIDGATAGSVDNIRLIVESANQRSLTGEYKVFIIDECQILGGGRKENSPAWSALLKCIEEAPKYTIFIFCSTDPEKIPAAILNRVQRYTFLPISSIEIKNRLEYISKQEGFTNYEPVCELISKAVNGGMRDAITYLDQVSQYSTNLSLDVAKSILGGLSYENMFKLTWAIQQQDDSSIIKLIEELQ